MRSDQAVAPATEPVFELGDLLVAYLEQLGVEYVFGVPGGAIEPLYNALDRSQKRGGPRPVVARHETGGAFMADGYAKQTGKLGVCCATTGPGATNLITGVASAYENNIPLLVITAQTALSTFGRGAFQESSCTGINTVGLFEYCTQYNTLVSHPEQFEAKLATAVLTAFQSPAGPVHLSVPIDVMRAAADSTEPRYSLPKLLAKPAMVDMEAVSGLYEELVNAKKPVFLIGDGASAAVGSILSLALALDADVLVTPHAKGLVSPYHPLFRGVVGFAGHSSAKGVISNPAVDLLVVVGASLGEWSTFGWDTRWVLTKKIVHVESAEDNFTRTPMAKMHVRGQLSVIFDEINQRYFAETGKTPTSSLELTPERGEWHFTMDNLDAFESDATPIKPQRLMRELPLMFPPHTQYLADTGASFAWATHYLHPYDRRIAGKREYNCGLFRATLDFASMGWAIGSAVGTSLAREGTPVVCITGDGSLLMSGQEISVAVQEKLPVIFVILNDAAYGMVKHGQRMTGAAQVGSELPEANYADMARSLGAQGITIRSPQDLQNLDVASLCNRKGPTLLDVHIDREEAPPIEVRASQLQ